MNKPTLYRIYYNNPYFRSNPGETYLAYIGRTKNNLTSRLRQHFVNVHPFQKQLYIDNVAFIEYAEFNTVADMYVAEIVLINQLKPLLNRDDKAQDELTIPVDLSGIEWKLWDKPHLIKKWSEIENAN